MDPKVSSFSVMEFYRGKTILVTGVTGFIGKVMLEKFLRECPDIERIYALIRPRKNQSPNDRLDQLFTSPVLVAHQDKRELVHAVPGDIIAPGLGLTPADRQMLTEQVEVVIHNAATVVFIGKLGKFLDQNVYGTESIMKLCRQMTRLRSVVYVSTAFSNCHRTDIEERVVPVMPELGIDKYLNELERHREMAPQPGDPLLAGRPNPYTLSKAVAEWLIQERYGSLPVIICRPSIVINAVREPFPGWCDVKIGSTGAMCLVMTGVAQTFICDFRCRSGLIPVDLVANGLIVAGAYRASTAYNPEHQVLHLTPSPEKSLTWGQLFNNGLPLCRETPTMKLVRPVSVNLENRARTVSDKIKWSGSIVSHYLFAYLVDMVCLILGQRRFMVFLMNRLFSSCNHLKYFSLRDWKFHYHNIKVVGSLMAPEERARFPINADDLDWQRYISHIHFGCRQYLLNDKISTVPQAKIRQFRLELAFTVATLISRFILLAAVHHWMPSTGIWHVFQISIWIIFFLSSYRMLSKDFPRISESQKTKNLHE